MSDAVRGLNIGAVSKMTGMSAHTLRKWESRYGLVSPQRTATGRRVYSQTDIDRLLLVRELSVQGHQLGGLASLSTGELEAMLKHATPRVTGSFAQQRFLVVGQVIAPIARLMRAQVAAELEILPMQVGTWLKTDQQLEAFDKIVIEIPSLGRKQAEELEEFALSISNKLILVHGFAQQKQLRLLGALGVVCIRAPVDRDTLLRALDVEPQQIQSIDEPAPRRSLTDQQIALVGGRSPALQCECPSHIASILCELLAFEQYSGECATDEPGDAELHQYLARIAGRARSSFEGALERVALQEGISLDMSI